MICGELVCVLKTLESGRTEFVTFLHPVHEPRWTSWCLSFPVCTVGIINIIHTLSAWRLEGVRAQHLARDGPLCWSLGYYFCHCLKSLLTPEGHLYFASWIKKGWFFFRVFFSMQFIVSGTTQTGQLLRSHVSPQNKKWEKERSAWCKQGVEARECAQDL